MKNEPKGSDSIAPVSRGERDGSGKEWEGPEVAPGFHWVKDSTGSHLVSLDVEARERRFGW